MEVDTIIVGQGLAGSSLAYSLMLRGQKVLVIDRSDKGSSSRVAAGLITPLTGKGLNPAWRQEEYLTKAVKYYQDLELKSGRPFYFSQPVLRVFSSEKEERKWASKEGAQSRWATEEDVIPSAILSDNNAIKMNDGAWVDTIAYLSIIRELLIKEDAFREEDFSEEDVVFKGDQVIWKDVIARHIILCQGAYGLSGDDDSSWWFGDVPHRSAKGEILSLKIKGLDSSVRYHANGWLAPRGDGHWKAGASYDWVNLDSEPTDKGRDEILTRLETWLSKDLEIEVVEHVAGVRPIIRNSRPVIGFHAEKPQVGFFNGLGSKGALMAPAVAEHFAMHLCGECELDEELDLHFTAEPVKGFKIEKITGSLLHRAHGIIKEVINANEAETVVDATIGNGHDTLFLANCVGSEGKVIGFDIQEAAIISTKTRLEEAGVCGESYELYEESHANLSERVSVGVGVIMFNLGYLPSGDKEIITKVESTMKALKSALDKLRQGGVLSVMCYPGHAGGDTEAAAVKEWFTEVDGDRYGVTLFQREGAKETTPFLLVAQKQ